MKQLTSSGCVIAILMTWTGVHIAAGQGNVPAVQTAVPRAAVNRSAPVAKPVVNTSVAPLVIARPATFSRTSFNGYAPRINGQSASNLRRNYSPLTPPLNPTFAAANAQPARLGGQEPITLDPATREKELQAVATVRQERILTDQHRLIKGRWPVTTPDPGTGPQLNPPQSPADNAKGRNRNDRMNYFDAFRRHHHEWHDRDWWYHHCDTIVFVSSGYYFLDGSYWYPAWGYDPLQTYYDYDGPIYTYGDLLPDEVIANVQAALQDVGYYLGPVTGSLDVSLRAALANFQRDYGLPISGAIDEATVQTLGLN